MTAQTNGQHGVNGGKWHARYPELGTGPISIEPYISREYFEKEREHILVLWYFPECKIVVFSGA